MPRKGVPIDVGVIGVGSMGRHHARVYDEYPQANLVGVSDASEGTAADVAEKHGTESLPFDELLGRVDAVSIAVPTPYHFDIATTCLDANVAALVEKPVLESLERAEEFRSRVERADVPVQVGHVERFNPAVRVLSEIVEDLTIVSVRARRLGPPPERAIEDSAVLDLMIHDVDVVLSVLGESPGAIVSAGVDANRHAAALLEFDSGAMASLTASRKTQRKVRTLEITAEECYVELDYIDQSIEIHRRSVPEYVEGNGDVRFRHEHIVERPAVPNGEPLRLELEAFLEAVVEHRDPDVTVADGLESLAIARSIEECARERLGRLDPATNREVVAK